VDAFRQLNFIGSLFYGLLSTSISYSKDPEFESQQMADYGDGDNDFIQFLEVASGILL